MTGMGLNNRAAVLICLTCAGVIFLMDLFIPLGVAMGVLYVLPVLISLRTHRNDFTIGLAAAASVLVIGAFFFKPTVAEMWKVVFNRFLSLFAIWITAMLGFQRTQMLGEREKALSEREEAIQSLKILKGLLPICASCKKIRDDEGYWNDVAGYIHRHSEAEFTHSICPECVKKLYPDLP